jgi:hypothetical protein
LKKAHEQRVRGSSFVIHNPRFLLHVTSHIKRAFRIGLDENAWSVKPVGDRLQRKSLTFSNEAGGR